MNGGDGNDGVYGGVGDDPAIFGGSGTDDISGGWGDDTLNSRDNLANDSVSCGPNNDVANVDIGDKVNTLDCEDVNAN